MSNKRLLAAGLAGILAIGGALTVGTAAHAAPTSTVVSASTDTASQQIQTRWVRYAPLAKSYSVTVIPKGQDRVTFKRVADKAEALAMGEVLTFPAPGTSGPILTADGRAIQAVAPNGTVYGNVTTAAPTGAANQTWQLTAGNELVIKLGSVEYILGGVTAAPNNSYYLQIGKRGTIADTTLLISPPLTAKADFVDQVERSAQLVGTASPGSTIVVYTPTGSVTVVVPASGNWTLKAPGLNVGDNSIRVVEKEEGRQTAEVFVDVTIDEETAPETSSLTAQVDGVDNEEKTAQLSGEGTPGAAIVVTTPTGEVSTTVGKDGTWAIEVSGLSDGDNTIVVVQLVDGEQTGETTVDVRIEPLESPLAHPTAIVGAGLLLLGVSGFKRRRATI